jgi:hypothetical protein
MKISRSLFLTLTGSIAGSAGCYVAEPPPPPQVVYRYPPQAYPPGYPRYAYGTYPVPRPRPAPPRAVATATTTTPPSPVIEAGVVPTPVPTAEASVTPPPPAPTAEGGACLDASIVTIPDCSHVDATCRGSTFPAKQCGAYRAYLDPKVAAAAVSCMSGLASKQMCDATSAYACEKTALLQACPDTGLGPLCSVAATSCKSTASECSTLLSGLNEIGKRQVAGCIAKGCKAGLYSCVEGLASSNEH